MWSRGIQWLIFYTSFVCHIHTDNVIFKIAGSPAGKKGDEHNNMILALTPTAKISLKRTFDKITESFLESEDGFQAFDCYSGEMEMVF